MNSYSSPKVRPRSAYTDAQSTNHHYTKCILKWLAYNIFFPQFVFIARKVLLSTIDYNQNEKHTSTTRLIGLLKELDSNNKKLEIKCGRRLGVVLS